jgi:hypothetical protein
VTVFQLTIRVEADDDLTADDIRDALYDACENVPFAIEVTELVGPDA